MHSPAQVTTRPSRRTMTLPLSFGRRAHFGFPTLYRSVIARIALKVEPRFDSYMFIEQMPHVCGTRVERKFAELHERIQLVNADANTYLNDLCLNRNWRSHRAVLFLDPFGMQVTWDTIASIAKTEAIDLWLLFPLGTGANRLLKRDGKIPGSWRARLDATFGS